MSGCTERFYRQHDNKRNYGMLYAKKPERRKKRAKQKLDKTTATWKSEYLGKLTGNDYQPRIAAPSIEPSTGEEVEETRGVASMPEPAVIDTTGGFCGACQNYGHMR